MAKRHTADAENEVIEVTPPVETTPADVTPRIKLIGGVYDGEHLDWPAGTEHYDNDTHACPHPTGVWIYAKADPLLATAGYQTYTLSRAERVYGG